MAVIAKIDDREITADEFVDNLKLNNKLAQLLEDYISQQITVMAAKKQGISVTDDEIQKKFDNVRRVQGLHRAKDTNEFLDDLGVTLDTFQIHITDKLYNDKVLADLCNEYAILEYFNLNSPRFDSVDIEHMIVDTVDKAKEIVAVLHDDPDSFKDLAMAHSLDSETRDSGGVIGRVGRGSLPNEIESKIFNASEGEVIGPYKVEDGLYLSLIHI